MTEGTSFALKRMTDSLPGPGRFVMHRLQTVGLTGIRFMHENYFNLDDFKPDASIWRAFKINRVLDKATPCFDEDVICNHDAHFDVVQSCSLIPNVNTKFNQRPRLYDHLRIPDDFWQEWEPFFPKGVIYREFDRRALADFDEEAEEDQKEAEKQQKREEQQGEDAVGDEDDENGDSSASTENKKSPAEDDENDEEKSSGAVAVVAASRRSERADEDQDESDAEMKSEQAAGSSSGNEDSSSDGESTSSLAPSSDTSTSVAARRKSAAAKKRKQRRENAKANKGKKELQHENRKKGLEGVGARSLFVDENSDITITRPGGDVASLDLLGESKASSAGDEKSELDTTTGAPQEEDKDREVEDEAGASHLLKQFDALEEERRALLQSRKNRINMMLRTRAKEVNKALLLVMQYKFPVHVQNA